MVDSLMLSRNSIDWEERVEIVGDHSSLPWVAFVLVLTSNADSMQFQLLRS